jgi:hypothetical protein
MPMILDSPAFRFAMPDSQFKCSRYIQRWNVLLYPRHIGPQYLFPVCSNGERLTQ